MGFFEQRRGRQGAGRWPGAGRGSRARGVGGSRGKKSCTDRLDCADCGCGAFDCLSLMTVTVLLQALLGVFRASAVDPHTPRPAGAGARLASRVVRSYQLHVSARRAAPVCNLTPSCSRYGLEVLSSRGLLRGGVLVVRRLLACRAAA